MERLGHHRLAAGQDFAGMANIVWSAIKIDKPLFDQMNQTFVLADAFDWAAKMMDRNKSATPDAFLVGYYPMNNSKRAIAYLFPVRGA